MLVYDCEPVTVVVQIQTDISILLVKVHVQFRKFSQSVCSDTVSCVARRAGCHMSLSKLLLIVVTRIL